MAEMESAEWRRRRKEELLATQEGAKNSAEKPGPTTVTDDTFADFIKKHDVALIDFWAPWCGPCHMLAPVIEDVASRWQGRASVGKLDTEQNQRTARTYGIMSIPTVFVFKDGQPFKALVGVRPRGEYEAILTEAADDAPPGRTTRL